jgi:hypothetical protein
MTIVRWRKFAGKYASEAGMLLSSSIATFRARSPMQDRYVKTERKPASTFGSLAFLLRTKATKFVFDESNGEDLWSTKFSTSLTHFE